MWGKYREICKQYNKIGKKNNFQIIKSIMNNTYVILKYVIIGLGQATNYVGQVEIINYLLVRKLVLKLMLVPV